MSTEVVTYKRSSPFSEDIRRRLAEATVRVEHEGGLGDVFYQIHQDDGYDSLLGLKEGETGSVIIASHNPYAREIFEWIPTAGHLLIANCGFEDIRKVEWRRSVNIPVERHRVRTHRWPTKPLRFYPASSDAPALEELAALRPFIILAASGSSPSKSVPEPLADRIAQLAIQRRFNVVQVGRTYRFFISGEDNDQHRESPLPERPGLYSMIDRLTVPGVAAAMNLASGVVAPNTSSLILSYCQARPSLFCASQFDYDTFIKSAPAGYMFRLFDALNRHFPIPRYDETVAVNFLENLPR